MKRLKKVFYFWYFIAIIASGVVFYHGFFVSSFVLGAAMVGLGFGALTLLVTFHDDVLDWSTRS